MRRYRTRTTAWPAVADLMTALAVVGLAAALIVASRDVPPRCADPPNPESCVVAGSEIDSLSESIRELNDEKGALEALMRILKAENEFLKSLVIGFAPCWPRQTADGRPSYYRTYNVTVQGDRFSFARHGDWADTTAFHDALLRDTLRLELLPVLKDLPPGEVAAEAVDGFGERVYQAARDARYPPDCKFGVTLNRAANGDDVGVLTDAGFFPVYRD